MSRRIIVTGAYGVAAAAIAQALKGHAVVLSGGGDTAELRSLMQGPIPFDEPYTVMREPNGADYRNARRKGKGTAAAKRAAKKKRNRK